MPARFLLQYQGTVLRILPMTALPSITGLSPCDVLLSSRLHVRKTANTEVHRTTSPSHYCDGFSLNCTAFALCYSRHRNCFLFLQVLRRFNSLRSPTPKGVNEEVPFGHLWFNAYVRLARAFRCLSRPSSAT